MLLCLRVILWVCDDQPTISPLCAPRTTFKHPAPRTTLRTRLQVPKPFMPSSLGLAQKKLALISRSVSKMQVKMVYAWGNNAERHCLSN